MEGACDFSFVLLLLLLRHLQEEEEHVERERASAAVVRVAYGAAALVQGAAGNAVDSIAAAAAALHSSSSAHRICRERLHEQAAETELAEVQCPAVLVIPVQHVTKMHWGKGPVVRDSAEVDLKPTKCVAQLPQALHLRPALLRQQLCSQSAEHVTQAGSAKQPDRAHLMHSVCRLSSTLLNFFTCPDIVCRSSFFSSGPRSMSGCTSATTTSLASLACSGSSSSCLRPLCSTSSIFLQIASAACRIIKTQNHS